MNDAARWPLGVARRQRLAEPLRRRAHDGERVPHLVRDRRRELARAPRASRSAPTRERAASSAAVAGALAPPRLDDVAQEEAEQRERRAEPDRRRAPVTSRPPISKDAPSQTSDSVSTSAEARRRWRRPTSAGDRDERRPHAPERCNRRAGHRADSRPARRPAQRRRSGRTTSVWRPRHTPSRATAMAAAADRGGTPLGLDCPRKEVPHEHCSPHRRRFRSCCAFADLNAYVVWQYGYSGFLELATANAATIAVLVDLTIAPQLRHASGCGATHAGAASPSSPYLAVTALLGSIGPLLYVLINGRKAELPA